MQILNLINKERSNIDYSISRFPDGEVQITLGEFSHKEEIMILCRITNTEELFILMQVCDILRRHGMRFSIQIYYLMSMRMDRVMDFNRPLSLSIVCRVLDDLGAVEIGIYCPHSIEYKKFFRYTDVFEIPSRININWEDYQLVYPDKGSRDRYSNSKPFIFGSRIFGKKSRDSITGKITSIEVENPENLDTKPLLIKDDLCDGGGTFVGLAEAIRKINPNLELNVLVDHMVNPRGIEKLSKTFNHVWFTNSYKDWKKDWESQPTPFPDNITQIDIV